MNTPEELLKRAWDADYILKSAVFREAFDDVREGLISAIENGPLEEERLRDKYMLSLQLLVNIKAQIMSHIETYQMTLPDKEEI